MVRIDNGEWKIDDRNLKREKDHGTTGPKDKEQSANGEEEKELASGFCL